MAILIEGPCPKCEKHGHWWGKTQFEAMEMQSKGCEICVLKWAIGRAILIGFVTWGIVQAILWYSKLPP